MSKKNKLTLLYSILIACLISFNAGAWAAGYTFSTAEILILISLTFSMSVFLRENLRRK